ncbi:beta-glucosidase [Naumannella sp. ID2617S]|nr:beta-glucosidase [Naumannella sp. ID2617S]
MTATSADLDQLLSRLDLRQKVRLLTGEDFFTLYAEPAVGLGKLAFSDGPTGVRGLRFTGGNRVVLMPNATLLAASWDVTVLERVGDILGQEAERQQIHTVLGPTINLHRTPLGGRLFEAYSEDPLLTGKLAAAYVRGMQAHRVAACLKHLVANESETDRNFMDSRVADDVLREVYLLPFEIAWTEARPWSMMSAYNRVNGVFATEHSVVQQEIVKDEWGFDGLIMSDWLATKSTVAPANAGMDLVMPGPDGPWGDRLVAAVEAGEVAESCIDDKVLRLLRLAERTGALGEHRTWSQTVPAPDSAQRRRELIELAAAGMTVLRNRDSLLPLPHGVRLALIGRHGTETVCMGGGSAKVNPPHQVSIAEGLRAAGVSVSVCDGVEIRRRPVPATGEFVTHEGKSGMLVELYDADRALMESHHYDLGEFSVGQDDSTPRPVAYARIRATVQQSGPAEVGVRGTGRWQVRVGEHEEDVLLKVSGHDPGEAHFKPPHWQQRRELAAGTEIEAWLEIRPAEGVADQPSGHDQLDEVIASGLGTKTLIARPAPRPVEQVLAEAAEAAAAADVAVVVVGLTEQDETEAIDKETLRLPGEQDQLVHTVAAAARRTVVIVNSATPVLTPWAEEVDAIVVIGLPGQEGGHAVAAALLGELEPAGRLVTTWPSADGAAPAWQVEPDDRRGLDYSDGRFVGHRGYAPYGLAPEPAYWFGQGLGYASWEYADARLEPGEQAPRVRVRIDNTGERSSREVVQAYFQPERDDEPVRLVGWAAAEVAPGESAEVTVDCDPRLWRRWDTAANRWGQLDRRGEILLARGLGDVRARLALG